MGPLTGEIAYKHDVAGRRVEKKVDGYSTRYCYDGDHVIAEYDGNNNLLRKYIYGPGIDQPVSMIEVAQSNATYYYHFDALGSVVALSDASGDTVQTYEYSVYGEVAVEDANHTNPYMFAGVRYDIEIGLYYNRARYYNPFTGRFLQTDPIGYQAGMNLYTYCGNNPLVFVDPTGLVRVAFYDPEDPGGPGLAGGREFKEAADDTYFDYSFEMRSAADVIRKLAELKADGIEVTEVYFFDHGSGDGVQFGDDYLEFGEANLEEFSRILGKLLAETCTINLRQCYAAKGIEEPGTSSIVEFMALYSNRDVTGCTSTVGLFGSETGGGNTPDYDYDANLWMASTRLTHGMKIGMIWSPWNIVGNWNDWPENPNRPF